MNVKRSPYPNQFRDAFVLLLIEGLDVSLQALDPIAGEVSKPEKRGPEIPDRAFTFKRDRWRCGYCPRLVILEPVFHLFDLICEQEGVPCPVPYNWNWKGGLIHDAIRIHAATTDHVLPKARFPHLFRDRDNLFTSCPPCNAQKGDFTLEEMEWPDPRLKPRPRRDGWDGLTGLYKPLWERAGCPPGHSGSPTWHLQWLAALGLGID